MKQKLVRTQLVPPLGPMWQWGRESSEFPPKLANHVEMGEADLEIKVSVDSECSGRVELQQVVEVEIELELDV